jgi:uncharacterized protein
VNARRRGDAAERRVIAATEQHVRERMAGDASGHDWWHVERVRALARRIAREEGADEFVVDLAALLHDVDDYKLSGSEDAGPTAVREWLETQAVEPGLVDEVVAVVRGISFRGSGVADAPLGVEGRCARDADRLDALGAIGIARAFAYGGATGQPIHDPGLAPRRHETAEEYRSPTGTTVNHFHEKLLLLGERMSTSTGRRIARHRLRVLDEFLAEFDAEWEGRDGDGDVV